MANLALLADRLRRFSEGQQASEYAKLLWKPKEGQQTIRIVPYAFNDESPFVELRFYYNLGGAHYLAPCTFGKPDPIQEVIETLRSSGSTEEKEIAAKLNAVSRTYAPVIVRGEEAMGVRYWGFGVTVYKQLLGLMTNPDWGDITSLTEGNDIRIEFKKISAKKNVKTGQSFPETILTPVPKKTPVVDPTRRDLMEKVRQQTDILKIFPLKSYDELKAAVDKYLNPESVVDESPEEVPAQSVTPTPSAAVAPTADGATPAGAEVASQFAKFFAPKV